MTDYSEIMQDLPRLIRERDDALRNEDWSHALDLSNMIGTIEMFTSVWITEKIKSMRESIRSSTCLNAGLGSSKGK